MKKASTRRQQHPQKNQPSNQNQDLCTRKVSLLRHIFLLVLIFVPAGFVFQITESIRNILRSTACISHKSFFGYRRQGENCWIHFWIWPVSHWSCADHRLHLQKHLSYCYSKKLSGHQISLLLTKKNPQNLRKIVIQANFLRFLILVYMDDIFIFKYLCLCQQIFSLQLVLRNCFSSPRTLLCGLLQQNQLNLISALFSTWKEPFTEFCRKHRPKFFSCLQWSWRITERAKTCTWWCTAESGGLGEVVWSYVKNDLSFPIEPVSTSLRSLQPPATVLSPKAQPGAMPLLLAGILKQSWYWAWPRTWFPVCSSGALLCNTSCWAIFVFLVSAC